jgi:hypothetical protein
MAKLLDAHADLRVQLEVLTNEGVATAAIEGEKFDPNSLRSLLARRLDLPTAGLSRATRSVEGLVDPACTKSALGNFADDRPCKSFPGQSATSKCTIEPRLEIVSTRK